MKQIDANKLHSMIIGAYELLNENKELVNELNVFPVPDGDTGTNMTMTIKSGLDRINESSSNSVEEISKAFSQGTLMGARGNSGVILSQLVRGLSKSLKGKNVIEVSDIRDAFENANTAAYKAVMKPTEGTILTVNQKMTDMSKTIYRDDISIDEYLYIIINEGEKALANTPNQLPVLKEAGVVDSGAQGLIFLLRGALNALNSNIENTVDLQEAMPQIAKVLSYEVNFDLAITKENLEVLEKTLKSIAEEINIEFNDNTINASLKTDNPYKVVQILVTYGVILKLEVLNLKPNLDKFNESKKKKSKKYGFIAVSRGEGYDSILKSMNIDQIISGGQTMNPSTEDIYKSLENIDAENIIIFPNNKNIIMSAKQAAEVSEKNCYVVETRSIPETFAAVLEFDGNLSPEENIENMNEVIEDIHIAEVSISIRDTTVNNIEIKKNEYIGILDGDIVTSKKNIDDTALDLISKGIEKDDISLITVYYGEEIEKRKAKDFIKKLNKKYPDIDIELVYGGQPVYYYTITLE